MEPHSHRPPQELKPYEAVFSISDGELKPVTRRTNSLGVSKVPCHNCRANERLCDRQRPKCGSCIKINHSCGYTLDFRWKSPSMAGRPLGISHSERCYSPILRSVSPFSANSPAVHEALYYHHHCFADIAADTVGCQLYLFRSMVSLVADSIALQHAVVLLAATHRQKPAIELMTLRSKVLKTFAKTLPRLEDTTKLAVILLLLFTDFVHSGQSSWFTHLSAVAKIMEKMHQGKDRPSPLQDDFHRAMVFQFYWFDTMNALLVVRPPILPAMFLEDTLRISEEQAESKLDSITFDAFGFTKRMFLLLNHIVRGDDNSIENIQALEIPDVDCLIDHGWTRKDAEERIHTEQVWKHATATYLMTRLPPYRWPRHVFELHAQQVFEHASCLSPSSAKRRRILFPLLFAGSCTPYSERKEFMRRYCVECFRDTKFGVFQMGLGILQQVWMLRSQEDEERKEVGRRAYSCWRNVTAVTDGAFVNGV